MSPARSAVTTAPDAAPRAPVRGADAGPLAARVGCRRALIMLTVL